ncbi:YdcF family protein [Thermodesulfobacterium hydrogeniphilum]|uniref:YdcF family protein n=1 Tax=Thermodesulfobacterium hydrogeniphilum TaxID=161156 RepID=UPI0005711C08|nr:YdcF family protein [Thermodesulfobacterium hydrogeniphilum]
MPNILFSLKKLILFLCYPSSLIFIFLFLVSIYVVLDKRRGRRRLLLFLAIFLYYLSTTPFLPYLMLKHLEKKYTIPSPSEIQKCKKIIVLTGRIYGEKNLSLEERFSRETLIRFLKALDLKRQYPKKEIIVLGGSYEDENFKGASYLKKLAEKLGYKVKALDTPLDTITSTKVLKNYLSNSTGNFKEPFLLLTSAYHLPRAIYLFKKQGLNPIPYPTNYNYKLCKPNFTILEFLPNDLYLTFTNMAFHEYLGLIFYKIKFTIAK